MYQRRITGIRIAQYQLGMMDDENDLAVGIAEYIDDLFIALHKVGEEE